MIQSRIQALRDARQAELPEEENYPDAPIPLVAFHDQDPASQPTNLELGDWSSRVVRPDKRGAVDSTVPPILERRHIDRDAWQKLLRPSANRFGRAIGTLDRLIQYAKAMGQQYLRGQRQSQRLFGSA